VDELAKVPIRVTPMGKDRQGRRFWWFPGARDRIYVQANPSEMDVTPACFGQGEEHWFVFTSKEDVLALEASLNPLGVCEGALKVEVARLLSPYNISAFADRPPAMEKAADADMAGADAAPDGEDNA